VALLQSLYAWLDARYQDGESLDPPPLWILRENKWRASRWGIDADIIIDLAGHTAPMLKELEKLMGCIERYAGPLQAGPELSWMARTLGKGLSYERQRAVFDVTNSLVSVTDSLVEEFRTNRPLVD
jgi:glutamate---cysteine ligase / carboxylate-amine ligase